MSITDNADPVGLTGCATHDADSLMRRAQAGCITDIQRMSLLTA